MAGTSGAVIDYPAASTAIGQQPSVLPLTGDLGPALSYLAAPHLGTLVPGGTDRYAFSLRPSELAAPPTGTVYLGVVVEAETGSTLAPAMPVIQGLTPLASRSGGGSAFALYAIDTEGLKLIELAGADAATSGAYKLRVFVAGDVNVDGKVDGIDGQLLTDALDQPVSEHSSLIIQNSALDTNRDGRLDSEDVQLLGRNLGFAANQAPVATNAIGKTHQDMDLVFSLGALPSAISHQPSALAADPEEDPIFFRLVGAEHGTAALSQDGQTVVFTPELGYAGPASFRFVADDGFSLSNEATVDVTVSDAPLTHLDFSVRNPRLDGPKHSTTLQLIGDFADEQDVLLPGSYLTFASTNPTAGTISASGRLSGQTVGTGVITATSHGLQAATAFSVGIPEDQTQQFLYGLGLNVYPGGVTLVENTGQRQILANLVDTIDLTQGSTGTQYYVSNSNVISVSTDGLITAGQSGDAVVTVINGPAEFLIPVHVEAAHVGATVLGTGGGIVQGTDGSLVAVAPNALEANTTVSIAPVMEANLPAALPGPFTFAGAFQLDVGADPLVVPAQLAISVSNQLAAGTQVFFFRYAELPDGQGGTMPVWMQEESGVVGADGVARTTSPPYAGVLQSGTWMVGVAPEGSIGEVRGDVSTFFPNQGSQFTAIAPMANGIAIGQRITSSYALALPTGTQTVNVVEQTVGGDIRITPTTVQAQAGQSVNVTTQVINTFIGPHHPSEAPEIQSGHIEIAGGVAELVLTGDRFTFHTAPEDLTVNFDVPVAGGATNRLTARPEATSTDTELRVRVPNGVIIGLADISVTRQKWEQVEAKTSNTLWLKVDPHYLFAANNFDSTVSVVDLRTQDVVTTVHVGEPGAFAGPRAIAITPDNTRAYVTLRQGSGIAVVDAQTLQEVDVNPSTAAFDHRIAMPNAHPFWAVADKAGKYLYVSDANTNAIYVIDIQPGSATYHTKVSQIMLTSAPNGLRGMDMSADGERLYVAAPGQGQAGGTGAHAVGKILVVDTDFTPGNKTLWQQIGTIQADQEPYYVTASLTDPAMITFTDRRSDNTGFGVIRATNPAQTQWSVGYTSRNLGSKKDSFDVNDASGIALLPKGTLGPTQTTDYAFITGWNRIVADDVSRDPFLKDRLSAEERADLGYTFTYPTGGNVGVIEDPFGPNPKLIAATVGEPLSLPDGLTLSPDGRFLYAAYSADNHVKVFDVGQMLATIQANRGLTLNTTDGVQPLLAVTPLDGLNAAINVASLNTGRFTQGLAVQTPVAVHVGFGEGSGPVHALQVGSQTDPPPATGLLVAPEPGDTTPLFKWTVTWPTQALAEGVTTRLYVSSLKPSEGLFPTNSLDPFAQDLNPHRIVNGVEVVPQGMSEPGVQQFSFDLGSL
ncbi:MAG: beta-propeller fold lactonase family protein, partial [Nitrospirota bacterium]|nr:beta-propeller fold lactonase family protein [Nitrospirota bacterium]